MSEKFKKIRVKKEIEYYIREDIDFNTPKSAREVNAILHGENDGIPKISNSIRYNEKHVGHLFGHCSDFEIKIRGKPNKWGLVTEERIICEQKVIHSSDLLPQR